MRALFFRLIESIFYGVFAVLRLPVLLAIAAVGIYLSFRIGAWVFDTWKPLGLAAKDASPWLMGVSFLIAAIGSFASLRFTGFVGGRPPVITDIAVRGAQLTDAKTLARETRERDVKQVTLGGVPIPTELETRHFAIAGTTGSGKTLAITEMLETIRGRGDRALIADPAGNYLSRFYREGDLILNPFDLRSVGWNPFNEIAEPWDGAMLARAAIPEASGDSREWHFYAQTLLGELLKKLHAQGIRDKAFLLHLLTAATQDELRDALEDTPAAQLAHTGNEKLLSNTRAIIATYLSAWPYIPEGTFSIRDWVRNGTGWLYLSYRDNQLAMLRQLVAMWCELAIVEALSLAPSPSRRLWFVMDELDSLGRISANKDALTKLRKYGGAVIAGFQAFSQLEETYGTANARTLLSCFSNKLYLRAGDEYTARYMSEEIGTREIERESIGVSQQDGERAIGDSISLSRSVEALVLPSELQALPDRQGLLKLTGPYPLARIAVSVGNRSEKVSAFVEK